MNRNNARPISPENFIKVHSSYMEGFYNREIVQADNLQFERLSSVLMTLMGNIVLRGGLKLHVEKYMTISLSENGTEEMSTYIYSYQLSFAGYSNSDVFRYDNCHPHENVDHKSPFHKHEFDPPGMQKKGFPIEINFANWPPLNLVIEEANDYYLEMVESKKVDLRHLGEKRDSDPLASRD